MKDYENILKKEFSYSEKSFCYNLFRNEIWDKKMFSILVKSMKKCCEEMEGEERLPRWLAKGFFNIKIGVITAITNSSFNKEHEDLYYKKAIRRLNDLCEWFYRGDTPFMTDEYRRMMTNDENLDKIEHIVQNPLKENL